MSSSKQGLRRYHLGLDIGTNSIGWTAIDDHFSLLRVKGKNAIGVRTFKEGKRQQIDAVFERPGAA